MLHLIYSRKINSYSFTKVKATILGKIEFQIKKDLLITLNVHLTKFFCMFRNQIKSFFRATFGTHILMYLKSSFPAKEEKKMQAKRLRFYKQFLPSGSLYFDIGANYGNRIEPIINEDIKILAVEPQRECVKYLNLKFKNRIQVVPKGLGDKEEKKEMHISSNHVLSSFSEEWISKTQDRFKKYEWEETRTIEITTFDRLIEKHGKPQFAKIDVEGYELNVLNGLNTPIDMVSLEYAAPEGIDQIEDCLKRLNAIATNKIECNYSIGESMEWAGEKWYSFEETLKLIRSRKFTDSEFGDIYIRSL